MWSGLRTAVFNGCVYYRIRAATRALAKGMREAVAKWGGISTWNATTRSFKTPVWSISSAEGDQFAPSTAAFMVNYLVEDFHALVKVLREEGCNVFEKGQRQVTSAQAGSGGGA